MVVAKVLTEHWVVGSSARTDTVYVFDVMPWSTLYIVICCGSVGNAADGYVKTSCKTVCGSIADYPCNYTMIS